MSTKPAGSSDTALTRLQKLGGLFALCLSVAWLLDAAFRSPDVPFLTGRPDWITASVPLDADAIQVDLDRVPVVVFERRFDLDRVPARATSSARAIARAEIVLNGRTVHVDDADASWRRTRRVDVAEALRVGRNDLVVHVTNARGPALLQLEIEDGDGRALVETDARWSALLPIPGRPGRFRVDAVRADDTRPHPQSATLPATGVLLVRYAPVLALVFALSALLHVALGRTLPSRVVERSPEIVLGLGTLVWACVYAFKSTRLPVLMGFDIVGHLQYIDFLLENHALPLATDGWSTYHPPLGHLVAALFAGLPGVERESAAAQWLYRLPMFAAGLGNVWMTYFASRRLFPGDALRPSLATGFAALLPMNLYMSAYVSNEPLHSFLVSASLALATVVLVEPTATARRLAALGATIGLAISTKFTALLLVPLVAFFVGVKVRIVEHASLRRASIASATLLAAVAAVGGWVYVRNWVLLGRPVVGNWDLPGNRVWWEQPGFHTLDYYLSFGESLRYPFFAGYRSFWDGIYSTLWGDGLVAGMIRISTRHAAWNYDFMTLCYWLAFPATVAIVLGFGRALRSCVRGDDVNRRAAMSLLVAFLYASSFALLWITMRLPYYAQAKAFYVLSAIVPLSIVAALGLAWVPERLAGRWLPVRLVYSGWLGTLVASILLAFLG